MPDSTPDNKPRLRGNRFPDRAPCVNCEMSRERTTPTANGVSKENPRDGRIILVEQEPLRETAAANCASAKARLERARAVWHSFERKDKPAFVR